MIGIAPPSASIWMSVGCQSHVQMLKFLPFILDIEPMLAMKKISEIAETVAVEELHQINVATVTSQSSADQEGRDAVRVTIVLRPDRASQLEGDALLDTLVKIQARLENAGEERLAIVEYATQAELDESGDS